MKKMSKRTYYRRKKRAKELGVSMESLPDNRGKHGNHAKGMNSARWNNNLITSHKYKLVRVGKEHPLSFGGGYAYEHIVVWVSAGRKRPIKNKEVLHHKNGNALDNRMENLEVVPIKDHFNYHVNQKPIPSDLMIRELP